MTRTNIYSIRIPNRDRNMRLIDDNRIQNARDETISFLLNYAGGCEARITLGYYKGTKGKLFVEQTHIISAHVPDNEHDDIPVEDIELHCLELAKALNQECVMYSKTPSKMKLVFQVSVKDALLSI